MATINCPSCGKPNPDTVEICQYCGTALKRTSTVPLPPLHPGDMPTKKKTSDLESTLPSWLRDIRQSSGDEPNLPQEKPAQASTPKPVEPAVTPPVKPTPPKPKEAASPLDFLAGLAQANDEEEEVPDWLKSLQSSTPAAPAEPAKAPESPTKESTDWLSSLQPDVQQNEPPAPSEPDWGFGDQPATFNFDESASQASQISGDTPDWLNALKAQADESPQPAAFETPSNAPSTDWQTPADTGTPDWLSALSDSGIGATSVEPEPTRQPPAQADETPDWLSTLSDSGISEAPVSSAPKPAEQPAAQTGDTPDWLSALSDSGIGTTPAQVEPANQPPAQGDDTADWLASLSGPAPAEQPATPSASSDDTPDWLSSLGSETAPSEPFAAASAPDSGTPDWLSSLSESSAAPVEQPSTPSAPSSDDTPDWLASLGGNEAVASEPFSAASAPDNLDWLSSLGSGPSVTEETSAPSAAAQQPEVETPDWMAGLGTGSAAPVESPASAPDADLPPWLSDLTSDVQPVQPPAEQITPKETTPPAAQPPVESDVPAWMADLQTPSASEGPSSTDMPDWMTGLSAEPSQTPATDASGSVPAMDSELPSWLADAMGEKPVEKPASGGKPFSTGALRELGPMEETPDWMAKVGGPSPTPVEIPPETPPQAPATPAKPGSAFPASSEAPTVPPSAGEEQNLESIFSMDMPDWLSGFTPTEAETSEAKSVEQQPVDENLSPAELPSWVQAMRPVEDVISGKIGQAEDDDAPVENQGPLAGLRSVLPSLSVTSAIHHKPKTYSIRLQVADTQQAQAALLEQILNSESTPQAVVKRPEALVIRPLRWIIAGVLLLTILLGALWPDIVGSSSPLFPSPDASTEHSHIGAFKDIIDKLPDNANVLVVADYQPGFAGELELAAGPVLSQLMAKNARLAFISTSPVGSYLAERLVQQFTPKYEVGTQYVNLGYLPGGSGGIQVFAQLPLTTVGTDWFLGNLWEKDALKAVTKFSDFAAVIVMTDNPDTGRVWIEQAEPSLNPKPMLMVTSAQAEPMIRPYLASGQIKGMVSGLEDATLYENLLSIKGRARSDWDAFGMAVLAAELLIIIGAIWGLVSGYLARRAQKTEQDEA